MARILVTGAQGQLGQELGIELLREGFEVVKAGRDLLDITKEQEVFAAISNLKLDAVINAAAYTAVDKAESEQSLAYEINALGPKYIAQACAHNHIPLIHISTDYVFAKSTGKSHTEDEQTYCEGVYAQTKLDGENFIKESGCKYLIVRTSWVFGRFGKNFVKAIFNKAKNSDTLAVVDDELGNPTPALGLAYGIVKMLKQVLMPDFDAFGTYHFSGMPALNRYEFAKEIVRIASEGKYLDHEVKITAIKKADLNLSARRPDDSLLNCSKCENIFNLTMPSWRDYILQTLD